MSALRTALAQYLATRRALGTQLLEPGQALGHFLDFLDSAGAEFITTSLALRWARQPPGVQLATWARRLCAVRCFAAWLCAFDPRNEVPAKGLIKARHRRKAPYIFSDQQVSLLMEAAAQLAPAPRALTTTTIIGLLAATGLRPGEALMLRVADVDLSSGILTVHKTKFGKTRFVPVDESTRVALAGYSTQLAALGLERRCDRFFVDRHASYVKACTLRRAFARLCVAAGLRQPAAAKRIGRGPRLQDLRHTFATRRLVEWYRAGVDLQRKTVALATYLGHVDIAHTYWYLEAVPELLQLATERLMSAAPETQR